MAKAKSKKGRMDMQAMMEIYTKVETPGAPHQRLGSLVGNWLTKTTALLMDPGTAPMESKGTLCYRNILKKQSNFKKILVKV